MHKLSLGSILAAALKIAWILFLVCLPVTSFPFFPPSIGGGALVRPLSIYPLIALLLLVVLPRLVRQSVPHTLLTLMPFGLAALASSMISLLQGIEPALGVSVVERLARGWITLGVGVAFYLAVALTPQSEADLRAALRWLYAGFALALSWGMVQAVYVVYFNQSYFRWVSSIQKFISLRRLMTNRISGLTYEPNWFAEQISLLLLPWLLASVLSGYSAFRWRWKWVTVEWFLLAWAAVLLAFTFSRAGLIGLLALTFVGFLFFRPPRASAQPRSKASLTRRLVEASLIVAALAGVIYLAGANNIFFSRIWNYWSEVKKPSLTGYFEYLGFGARFTYSETAFRTYQSHPVFGVGLGNYAFYFKEMLPDRSLAEIPEVLRLITPDVGRDRLITPKNLYFRLLAETGLVGTATFLAFLIALLGCAIYLWLSQQPAHRYWGLASLLGLIAFVLAAFSFDSFAIPNMWVVFGFITAAARLFRNQEALP